jgi:hypothetical protein
VCPTNENAGRFINLCLALCMRLTDVKCPQVVSRVSCVMKKQQRGTIAERKDTGEFSILGFFLFGNLVKCLLICELFLSHR